MQILGRYLLVRFLASLAFVLVVLVLLVLVVEILLNVEDIVEADNGVTTLFLKIGSGYLLQYLLPAAALFGGFVALGGAARARETIALKAGGVSLEPAVHQGHLDELSRVGALFVPLLRRRPGRLGSDGRPAGEGREDGRGQGAADGGAELRPDLSAAPAAPRSRR